MSKDKNLAVAIRPTETAKAPSKTDILRAGAILIHKKRTEELEENKRRWENLETLIQTEIGRLVLKVPGILRVCDYFRSSNPKELTVEITLRMGPDLEAMYKEFCEIGLQRVDSVDEIYRDLATKAKDKPCQSILNDKVLSAQILEASEKLLED